MRLSRLCLTAACALGALTASAEKVQFNRDIRPIFSDTCFACHGPDENKIKGGLRLDSLEAARKGGKSGEAAIIPGKPDASEVMKRLRTDDADDHMPPAEFHKVLTKDQIALVERWIKEGAEYQGHWAFQIPAKPAVPKIPADGNAIDAFLAAPLASKELTPNGPATCRLSWRTTRPRPGPKPSIVCWPHLTTAKTWPCSGSTSPVTPTPTVSRATRSA